MADFVAQWEGEEAAPRLLKSLAAPEDCCADEFISFVTPGRTHRQILAKHAIGSDVTAWNEITGESTNLPKAAEPEPARCLSLYKDPTTGSVRVLVARRKVIEVWNGENHALVGTIATDVPISSMCVYYEAKEGRARMVVGAADAVFIFDIASGELLRRIEGFQWGFDWVASFVLGDSEQRMIAADAYGNIICYDPESQGERVWDVEGYDADVFDAHIWQSAVDPTSAKLVMLLVGHFSPPSVRIIDAATGVLCTELNCRASPPSTIATFTAPEDGTLRIAMARRAGGVNIFDESMALVQELGDEAWVSNTLLIYASEGGRARMLASGDHAVRLIDVSDGKLLWEVKYDEAENAVNQLHLYSAEGKYRLVVCCCGDPIHLYELEGAPAAAVVSMRAANKR
jgi:hypothetical protein